MKYGILYLRFIFPNLKKLMKCLTILWFNWGSTVLLLFGLTSNTGFRIVLRFWLSNLPLLKNHFSIEMFLIVITTSNLLVDCRNHLMNFFIKQCWNRLSHCFRKEGDLFLKVMTVSLRLETTNLRKYSFVINILLKTEKLLGNLSILFHSFLVWKFVFKVIDMTLKDWKFTPPSCSSFFISKRTQLSSEVSSLLLHMPRSWTIDKKMGKLRTDKKILREILPLWLWERIKTK